MSNEKQDLELKKFIEVNEDSLLELWDSYKFEKYEGSFFHYDDVDYFNEELFVEMSREVLEGRIQL